MADESRRYYTQLPNIVDDMDLSVYAFRLYAHLKRVAGDSGTCWQSVSTLAEACKMSRGSVVNARVELEKAGLIRTEEEHNPRGGRDFKKITIVDIWNKNVTQYASTPGEQASSPDELASSPHELTSSPGQLKNNPIKNNPLRINKEEGDKSPPPPKRKRPSRADPRTSHPAIQAIKVVTGHYPSKDVYDQLIAVVGEQPNIPKLKDCFEEWRLKGWRRDNYAWVKEWYVSGIPNRNGARASPTPAQPGGIREFMKSGKWKEGLEDYVEPE